MYGYIYLTTNLLNGKIYIGQHKATSFMSDNYIGSGVALLKAINKYGKKNFKCELLQEYQSKEELDCLEIEFIKKYNSTDRDIGYNIALGGNSLNLTEETMTNLKKTNKNRLLDTVIMTKDNHEYAVKKTDIDTFIADGYIIGRSQKAKTSLSENYNYESKGMLGKHQSSKQKEAVRIKNSRKRTEEEKTNYSAAKKVKNKYICMRTPDNKSTIRCLIKNKYYYLELGYIECINIAM